MGHPDDDIDSFYDHTYLGKWDLAAGPMTVRITNVIRGAIENRKARTKEKAPILELESRTGPMKPFVLKPTNRDIVKKMLGPNPKKWVGELITIYADPTVMFGRETVGGVRVRPVKPKGEPSPAQPPNENESTERAEQQAKLERAQEEESNK